MPDEKALLDKLLSSFSVYQSGVQTALGIAKASTLQQKMKEESEAIKTEKDKESEQNK